MLSPGRIPMSDDEHRGVEKLLAEHEGEQAGLTRRDPGDSGPVLVHIGGDTWEIAEDGKRKKVS